MTDLYHENKHLLMMYALKILRNEQMAEDAVHNSFLSIIKNKDKYLDLDCRDFRRLAVVIVRNKCIDILRTQKHYSNKSMDELEIFLGSNETSVEQQVETASEYEIIRKHLNSIDEISKQVLIMKYAIGMSYKEIAGELGMTPKHVDTRIMRAKKKVRKLLEKDVMNDE